MPSWLTSFWDRVRGAQLDRIEAQTTLILKVVKLMAGELERLTQEVAETSTAVDSAIVLLGGLKAALDAAIAQLPNTTALNALSDSLDAKQSELAAAIVANTPQP